MGRQKAVTDAASCIALMTGLALGADALAQASPSEPTGPASKDEAPTLSEVVVTGSRISRADYVSNTPIQTIPSALIQDTPGVTLERALNSLPQFTAAAGAATTTFPGRNGQAQLDLRGLGPNRTLVLLNGRRVLPAAADGAVDINVIPSGLIQSIETITGGASAVYGSDAISGVVNFKLNNNFSGAQFDVQYGDTFEGGGETARISATVGGQFAADRGSGVLFMEYADRQRLTRAERDSVAQSIYVTIIPSPTINFAALTPSQAAVDSVFGEYGAAPGTISRTVRVGVNQDGTLFTANPVTSAPFNYRDGYSDTVVNNGNILVAPFGYFYDLQVPLERFSTFGRAQYALNDSVTVFGEAFFTQYETLAQRPPTGPGIGNFVVNVPATNPFIPAPLRTLLQSRANPNAPFAISALFEEQFGPQFFQNRNTNYQGTLGVEGALGGSVTWDTFVSYGRVDTSSASLAGSSRSALQTLINAPDGGNSICAGGYNPFTSNAPLSAACVTYVGRSATTTNVFDQLVGEANLRGTVLTLPAGALRFAAGFGYRENSYDSRPDALYQTNDFAGQGVSLPAEGDQDVQEFYVELLVPLLSNLPLVQLLEADVAYRFSDYSSVGGVQTYKSDLSWTVNNSVRFRGGYARAIRAPSLGELNSPSTPLGVQIGSPSATTSAGDPCDVRSSYRVGPNGADVRALCIAQGVPEGAVDSFIFASQTVFGTTSGNPDLSEETADTFTAGVVWEPSFSAAALSDISVSLDYFNITVEDAIGPLPFSTALSRCFNGDGVSNPGYSNTDPNCAVIVRNSTGTIGNAITPTLNLGSYETSGVDLQIDWRAALVDFGLPGNFGDVALNFAGTYLDAFEVQTLPGSPSLDFAGYTSGAITTSVMPEFRSLTSLSYIHGPLTLGLRWRHLSSVDDVSLVTNPSSTIPGVKAFDYFDLNLRWEVNDHLQLRFAVNNLGDLDPPQVGSTSGTTDFNTYDTFGRSFVVGVGGGF